LIGQRIGPGVIAERFVHQPHFVTVPNHEFDQEGTLRIVATVDGGEILLPVKPFVSEVSFTIYGWRLVNLDTFQYTGNAGRRFPQYVTPGVVNL